MLPPLIEAALADPELEDGLARMREAALAVQAGHAYGRVMRARRESAEVARKLREADAEYRAFGRTERERIEVHGLAEARLRAAWGR
ncbi:hypothetical protein ACFW1A_21705 [Kitasatospora sp. NPDC058965]|uniref:hypothetical protein n=1 Tax=Kitasatospora sp. NPDC058965 TaxID=3346682 RepID=UPI00367C815D